LWYINVGNYWAYVKCILIGEHWDVRFGTLTRNRIRLRTKAYGRQRSYWCEAWGFFSLKHSHSGFLHFTIHVALNVNIKFSQKSITSFLGFVVYLRLHLSTQKEEESRFDSYTTKHADRLIYRQEMGVRVFWLRIYIKPTFWLNLNEHSDRKDRAQLLFRLHNIDRPKF
jgi:hypothetical protein